MNTTRSSPIGVMILLLILIGGVLGFVFGTQTNFGQVSPPQEHQAVINTIIIKDTRWNIQLVPVCVHASEVEWNKFSIVELATFEEGRIYKQSTWVWQRYGDTEICMTLVGPGEDGTTIMIEVARLGVNPFEVKVAGETKLTIQEATSNPDTGYYMFTVQISATS